MENKSIKNFSIIIAVLAVTLLYSIYERNKVIDLYNTGGDDVIMVNNLPNFTFTDLEGNEVRASVLKEETPLLVIHFWGTWCPPCIPEFPEFIQLTQKMASEKRVKFLVVAVNDQVEAVEKFLKKTPGIKDNVILAVDPESKGMNLFGTVKVPETHVYLQGKSVKRWLGPQKWQNNYYFKYISDIL